MVANDAGAPAAEPVLLEDQRGAVLELTLNRPKVLNALSFELLRALADALGRAAADDTVAVAIVTGAGRAFAAGADIQELARMTGGEFLASDVFRAWDEVAAFPKPLIAAVNGYALGGGLELAMSCDVIVASQEARFGQPEILLGLIPGAGGTQRLPRVVGKYVASEMVFAGRQLAAAEAERFGLVNRVVPPALVLDSAREIADRIAAQAPLALRQAKAALRAAFEGSLSQGLEGERQRFYTLFGTEDQREGTRAFLEKRAAVWKGR
jgi:enoyl-CoA hydratase